MAFHGNGNAGVEDYLSGGKSQRKKYDHVALREAACLPYFIWVPQLFIFVKLLNTVKLYMKFSTTSTY